MPTDLVITQIEQNQLAASSYRAGENLATFDIVYPVVSGSNTLYYKAIANDTIIQANAAVIVLNAVSLGKVFAGVGLVNENLIMATTPALVGGEIYVVSPNTFGKISPLADLVATNILTIVGYGINATTMLTRFDATQIVMP